MYPNNMMINPIQPVGMYPVMMPMQPMTIKIDIGPSGVNVQQEPPTQNTDSKDNHNHASIYDMPKVSLYGSKSDDKKQVEKETEKKNLEEKTQETTMAQALAAQAAVVPPVTTQTKTAEVVTAQKSEEKEDRKEDRKVQNRKPEIVKPEQMKTGIDLDGLMNILNSKDYEEQADAMEAISEVTLYAPDRANELLDSKVVDSLLGIMGKDTSKLQGKDKEMAERNKEYAMFTTATLQNLYAQEVKNVAKATVPPEDLIGMAGIVKELKTNPNASVREAAVASLGYVNKPEYKNVINPLLQEAANDVSAAVKAQANKQLHNV